LSSKQQVLVIGGTQFIGKSLVTALRKAGHHITVLHRGAAHPFGPKVVNLVADRNDPKQLDAALAGRHFDVVFDNVYDWTRGTNAAHVEATARLFGPQLQRYVFISSVAAYGGGLNHYEGDGLVPDDHPDLYARNKAMSERALFRLHQRHGLPAVTLRLPFVYGPENPYYREQFFCDRLRDNRRIILPGDGRRLMQFVHVDDVAAACLAAMSVPAAAGHPFNITNPKSITQADLVSALAAAAGKASFECVRVPRETILRMGGHPMGPRLYFGCYFDLPPITMMAAKAQRVLKWKPIDFAQGLKETCKWWKSAGQNKQPDYVFEDLVLARAAAGISGTGA
jgi:2'-hydroxyisoflavone reductase